MARREWQKYLEWLSRSFKRLHFSAKGCEDNQGHNNDDLKASRLLTNMLSVNLEAYSYTSVGPSNSCCQKKKKKKCSDFRFQAWTFLDLRLKSKVIKNNCWSLMKNTWKTFQEKWNFLFQITTKKKKAEKKDFSCQWKWMKVWVSCVYWGMFNNNMFQYYYAVMITHSYCEKQKGISTSSRKD